MNDEQKPAEPKPVPDAAHPAAPPPAAPEVGGRGGPDPVRYGDWEKGGIAVDF
jgi:hypothetical protein